MRFCWWVGNGERQWPGGRASTSVAGVPWSCRGSGSAAPAQWHCWGRRGVVGMLRCWWADGGAPVAGRDDGGSGCAVAMFGLLWCCRGVRVMAGVGQQGCCWGGGWEGGASTAVAGVMRSCQCGGSAKPAHQHCWGGRGAADVLRCWRGGGGASVAGKDDGGSGCAVALLGLLRCCRGVRAVAGVDWLV